MVLVLIPILIAIVFVVATTLYHPKEFNIKTLRRSFYILSSIWLVAFFVLEAKEIDTIILLKSFWVEDRLVVGFMIVILWFLSTILIDYFFISANTVRSIKLKDIELTLSEINEIKIYDNDREKVNESLKNVIKCQTIMTQYINRIFSCEDELDVDEGYANIFKRYTTERIEIDLFYFKDDADLGDEMTSKLGQYEFDINSILYSINSIGVCVVENEKSMKKKRRRMLFFRVGTKFTEADYIVMVSGKRVIDDEYLALIDIVNYYETKIELALAKDSNNSAS